MGLREEKKKPTGRAEVEQKGKDEESKEERWKEREGGIWLQLTIYITVSWVQ